MTEQASGYASGRYIASLSAFGRPRELPLAGGWILERDIPGFDARDAMSAYPLLVARDWSKLSEDLATVGAGLVSLVVVTDPLGVYDERLLCDCFPDRVLPFKEHYVVDLAVRRADWIAPHHRRNARRALARVRVEVCADPVAALDEWVRLYGLLTRRHAIRGLAAFSAEAFALQLRTPGVVVLRAEAEGETVGMLLWYLRGDLAYYHLGAYTTKGYDSGASFALFHHALEYFAARGIRLLDLGGAAGTRVSKDDGLARFKRGWANAVRVAYLCGRVFDRDRYEELIDVTNTRSFEEHYFPAYRARERR